MNEINKEIHACRIPSKQYTRLHSYASDHRRQNRYIGQRSRDVSRRV